MITMSVRQLREALEFGNPDGAYNEDGLEQQETELTFFFREQDQISDEGQKLPRGVYCSLTEYPEEGCFGPLGLEQGD